MFEFGSRQICDSESPARSLGLDIKVAPVGGVLVLTLEVGVSVVLVLLGVLEGADVDQPLL